MDSSGADAPGRIELICGCMFSGKSERLLARLADARNRSIEAIAFKHASDDRYSKNQIVTHSGQRADALPIQQASQMLEKAGHADLVVLDEAHFFTDDLVAGCRQLAERGHELVLAGLDLDSWGLPFGQMPDLEAAADTIVRTYAVCARCGAQADHTQRLTPVESQKMIGGPEAYEPRCAKCFKAPPIHLRR
ncbi:MAG: thymidine kinase [Planctomycetota bacterium]|jgi:thymidine kinase